MAVNEPLVEAVSSQCPEVSTEQVAMVLDALELVTTGDPIGTILTKPDGSTATRTVSETGIHQWNVTGPDGSTWIERNPTLEGWDVLRRGLG